MASEPGPKPAPSSAMSKLKSALGLQPGPKLGPITTHPALSRQDSFPEICSTPSDIGIFEVAHNKCRDADGKFSWKKFFFEAPGRPATPRGPPTGAATASSGTGQ